MTQPAIQIGNNKVYSGHNLDVLKHLPNNSIDSIVTDPPYELGFMSKTWDKSGIAYSVELWQECLRVLKPGGHLLAFGGTRTWHRLAVAIEDAGFEIRDNIAWLYGSGFPKSHNISKAIDKASGYDGEVIGTETVDIGMQGGSMHAGRETKLAQREIKELSPEAQKWDGWGTALKPAHEPIVVARKPVVGTVAENVLQFGVGALNIDASRIGTEVISVHNAPVGSFAGGEQDRGSDTESYREHIGRWPANIILDEYTAELLDEQSGISKSQGGTNPIKKSMFNLGSETLQPSGGFGDVGGASRFFYVAKASKRDRNEGLDQLPKIQMEVGDERPSGNSWERRGKQKAQPRQNFHPTVKPTSLMTYLIKLVTPEGGTVLDPFTGSGSTGKAAILEDYKFIGIELTAEYLPIIAGRLQHAEQTKQTEKEDDLFS
jgi:DNA modification methylase